MMNKFTRWALIATVCGLMAACGKSEKEQAKEAPPVMSAKDMIDKYCVKGDAAAQKELAQACKAEQEKFGKGYTEGSNCRELQSAFKQIDVIRKQTPGACRTSLRF